MQVMVDGGELFQSTSLLRGTTSVKSIIWTVNQFQSTSLLRGTTWLACFLTLKPWAFQSTSLLRGTTRSTSPRPVQAAQFQSTSLLRGTTACNGIDSRQNGNFNPRPSCEGRPFWLIAVMLDGNFNPRPSCEGRRCIAFCVILGCLYFNPRPSCEGRPSVKYLSISAFVFQSTSLLRGTTIWCKSNQFRVFISIHVPLARDDMQYNSSRDLCFNFNPRPSCEGRPRPFCL